MRSRILLFLLVVFQSNWLFGQSLTLEYVDQYIKMSQPEMEFGDREKLYVVDGIPYDGVGIESKLVKYNLDDKFISIDYFFSDSISTTVFKPNLLIVLIHKASPLKLKDKKEELHRVREVFLNVSEFPAFMINDKLLGIEEARRSISVLKPRNIDHVIVNKHAPLSIYGANAKYGLIRIWTKN
ncbi:hypothetical protein [Roseivirga seohaensis]|uniref:hypothetical protein n=1 Tax=Roseivirga seohaensis TaxID=1914963 RepID=UPI003BAC897E